MDLVKFFTNKKSSSSQSLTNHSDTNRGSSIIENRITGSFTSDFPYDIQKRQLGFLLTLGGLVWGATLFGYLQSSKVAELESSIEDFSFRQDKIIHLMSTQNEQISVNRDHIKHLAKILHEVLRVIQTNANAIKLEAGTIYIRHLCSQLRVLMNKYLSIIQAASMQRLATNAITALGATEALKEIKTLANKKGLEPVINNIGHLFQLPCSFSVTKFGLRLCIHLPLFAKHNVLELHRFLAPPIQLTSSVSGVIHSDKHLLALGRDLTNTRIFTEVSELQLSLCLNINSVKICPHAGQVLHREPFGTCLYHLFYSMHREALKTCRVFLKKPQDSAVPISKTDFLTYTAEPATYRILCQGNGTKLEGLQLHGIQTINVPLGCVAELPSFLLSPMQDYYFTEEPRSFQWTLPPQNLWSSNMTETQLNKAYRAIEDDVGFPSITPVDISIIKKLHSPWHFFHPPSLISLAVCGFLLVVFIILLVLICKAYRNDSKNNIPASCPNPGIELYPLLNNAPKQG